MTQPKGPHKTIVIYSRLEEIEMVMGKVTAYIESNGYGGAKYGRLMEALYEALVNAIIHGNKQDNEKEVRVTCYDDEEIFQVRVIDEGNGFDKTSIPNPRSLPNILKSHGRGIFIIERYVDKLAFNEKGNEITMTIRK